MARHDYVRSSGNWNNKARVVHAAKFGRISLHLCLLQCRLQGLATSERSERFLEIVQLEIATFSADLLMGFFLEFYFDIQRSCRIFASRKMIVFIWLIFIQDIYSRTSIVTNLVKDILVLRAIFERNFILNICIETIEEW